TLTPQIFYQYSKELSNPHGSDVICEICACLISLINFLTHTVQM
ncbi:hypothetical protein SULYE_1593, partial [Sulfurihydrogenibium yellowstonense SS-5]